MSMRRVDCESHYCEISNHVCGVAASQETIQASEAFLVRKMPPLCGEWWRGPPSRASLRKLPREYKQNVEVPRAKAAQLHMRCFEQAILGVARSGL
ncbi:UNVERIFIED_CONTAM: hypothetical protein Sradi_2318300 [Sesamum radiatum]|uniref:Uncharacterized protein n=1 Tax=Sesamum radiatum TaxID=300843 RepID=A0AAW2T5R9_SESRA